MLTFRVEGYKMENQNQAEGNKIIVPYDKDRKTITFCDTYVDINGDVIKYDDIAVFQSAAQNNSFMYYIVFGNSFAYNFDFTTYDGTKHKFKRYGLALYGIGIYKRIKKEFETVSPNFYSIVLRKVGERLIDRIANGSTANICGLEITKDKITYVKNKKKTYVIDRSNFDRAINNSTYAANYAEIYIRDEKKPVFRVSLNEPNARLIVPIVNTFLEFRVQDARAAAGTQG